MRPIATLLLLAACQGAPTGRVTELLGGATIERGARNVTAYRVEGLQGPADRVLHGYPVLAGPVPVDAETQALLRDVLTSDDTYLWEIAKACEFMPGLLVRYEDDVTIDVLFCFSCDELEVHRDGTKTGREDFDPRRADLVRVAKRLFPDDEAIRKLNPGN